MKNIFLQYKPFFTFLVKFLVFYIVFIVLYKLYLNQFDSTTNQIDGITKTIAFQTKQFILLFDPNIQIVNHENEPSVKIIYNSKYIARIIEGCNGVSVMILFAAFIFAFSTQWMKTFLFIFFGTILIYLFNILRIVLLIFTLYYYPTYEVFLHETVFPLFIYGVVFILWILWITKFSGYVKKTIDK